MHKHKYHAIKTVIDGITFTSKAEAARYRVLALRQERGEISDLTLQPEFILQPGFTLHGKKWREIAYVADFRYVEGIAEVVEDVKGMKTETYNMKKKMFLKQYGKDCIFREVTNGKQIDIPVAVSICKA